MELKKCLNSFHIDYFVYKSNLSNFASLFSLITLTPERLSELVNDRRISRAYEACLILAGEKITFAKSTSPEDTADLEKLKQSLTNLAEYLLENFQSILETENGVFALRSFLRIVGQPDQLETAAANETRSNTKNKFKKEFNVKNLSVKLVPDEWKLSKYIKKFVTCLSDINMLEIGLVPSVSPCLSLLLRKLSTTYPKACADVVGNIHAQFVKKPNSFHSMIQDAIGSRFIESFLYACPVDLLVEFYLEQHLIPKIVVYAKHIYANYPVQTLIKYRLEKEPQVRNGQCIQREMSLELKRFLKNALYSV